MLAAKPSEDAGGVLGQLELFRERALGNFRDLLVAVAQDPAMLVWLDGRSNVRAQPQENFARELMELFTMGVGTFAETDVYAGARVFTGWNLARPGSGAAQHYTFNYNAAQHETTAKEFTFPIYPDGGRIDPGALGRVGHAGRPRSDQRGRAASGDRSAAGAQAVQLLRQRGRPAGRRARSTRCRSAYYDSGYEIEPIDARAAAVAAVPRSGELLQALQLAGGVRRRDR